MVIIPDPANPVTYIARTSYVLEDDVDQRTRLMV